MRLGGPIFESYDNPLEWVAAVRRAGYRAAGCPVPLDADDATVAAYAAAAEAADIVIAEVGGWSNPISDDPATRDAAIARCKAALAMAEKIGARCAVNIAGSRAAQWDGPHPANLDDETFDRIVATVREIIDAVASTRTVYTLETMPWVWPDSADSYLALIEAIDRKAFAVHLDPVNLISSPQRYYRNSLVLTECFEKLGPRIVACHAKDIILRDGLTVHLDEACPGDGYLDYRTYLAAAAKLDPDLPILLEHMTDPADYARAAAFLRKVAAEVGAEL